MARRLAARPGAEPRCRTSCEEASARSAARNRGSTPAYDRSEAAAGIALYAGPAAVPVGGGRARAGLEIDHSEPSGSRVAISRAGRRPPAHTAARPHNPAQQAPRTPAAPINTTTGTARTRPGIQKTDILIGCRPVVELGGFEPPTFSLRTRRATNCAIAPRTRTA